MVAITVILAAVIATFVMGLGSQMQQDAPRVQLTFNYDEDGATGPLQSGSPSGNLNVTHDGGDKVDPNEVTVTDGSTSMDWKGSSAITAGVTTTYAVDSDDTIRVVWQAGNADSATLGKWTGPDA